MQTQRGTVTCAAIAGLSDETPTVQESAVSAGSDTFFKGSPLWRGGATHKRHSQGAQQLGMDVFDAF